MKTRLNIYKGDNPDNYIWLDENGDKGKTDEELYRIISYEPDGTIKVIRDNKIRNTGNNPYEENSTFQWDTNKSDAGIRQNTDNTYCNYIADEGNYYGCNAWGNQNDTYLDGEQLKDKYYSKFYNK